MKKLRSRRLILVIDDEPLVRELLSETLLAAGYEVLTASGGAEGLKTAREAAPDLVLLDVMMPGMDGWQVVEALRKDSKTASIPVVMLTARSETEALLRSHELKVSDYFIKPVDPSELVSFLKRYVELGGEEG